MSRWGTGGLHWAEGQAIFQADCEVAPTVTQADLGIVKSGPASATVNGSFSYSVTVTNTGTAAATNVTVRQRVWRADRHGGHVHQPRRERHLHHTAERELQRRNPAGRPVGDGDDHGNRLRERVSAGGELGVRVGDGIPAVTSNTVTTTVPCPANVPSLALLKTATATVAQGGAVTYNVTVSNSGTGSATSVVNTDDVVITDDLDNAFTSVAASSTVGTCSVGANNVVTCNVGTLTAGQPATITITANAPAGTCPTVTNQATGTHAGGTIPSSGTVTTTVTGCPGGGQSEISVRIQKTNDANEDGIFTNNEEARTEGQDVDFHLVITNTSDETVEIVTLTDTFVQTALDLLDAECSTLAGMQLDPGESVTCTFTLENYSPPAQTAIVDVAEVCVGSSAAFRRPATRTPRGFGARSSSVRP